MLSNLSWVTLEARECCVWDSNPVRGSPCHAAPLFQPWARRAEPGQGFGGQGRGSGGRVTFLGGGKVRGSVPVPTAWSESLGSVWPRGKSSVKRSQGKTGDPGPAEGQRQPRSRWEMGTSLVGPGCKPGAVLCGPRLSPGLPPAHEAGGARRTAEQNPRQGGPWPDSTSAYLRNFGVSRHPTAAPTGVRREGRRRQGLTAFCLGLCVQPFGQPWEGRLLPPVVQVTPVHLGVYEIAPEVGRFTKRSAAGSAVSRAERRLSALETALSEGP